MKSEPIRPTCFGLTTITSCPNFCNKRLTQSIVFSVDAQTLARLARIDPQLLRPIKHPEKAQSALMVTRVRAALMGVRTSLVNTAPGLAKSMGERLPKCDADQMGVLQAASLPLKLRQLLELLLQEVESLTEKIKASDREIEQIVSKDYPETELLQQVGGVGPLIALTFILSVEDIHADRPQ